MTLYARTENLIRALQQSGLWNLGVTTPEIFWDEIVNPTWTEGSTTAKGYKQVMFERVESIASTADDQPAKDLIWGSVSKFVDNYLDHSIIDPAWQRILHDLQNQSDLIVVVATDHYAEATGAILSHFQSLGIKARPALQAGETGHVLVANSADVGRHKASREFWQTLQQVHGLVSVGQVIIVDDFGFNEPSFDQYADQQKIGERMDRTVAMLAEVFGAKTDAFPFFLQSQAGNDTSKEDRLRQDYRDLVNQAGRFIQDVLNEKGTRGTSTREVYRSGP